MLHPLLLKEYNNRWFILGRDHKITKYLTLALDRIINVEFDLTTTYHDEPFDGDDYYKNAIGVTVLNEEQLKEIVLKIDKSNAPYVLTKPFHSSQEIINHFNDGSVSIRIKVYLNLELERLILGFGNSIEVIEPLVLRRRIKHRLESALHLYDSL